MAQSQGSFLYSLKLRLEDGNAVQNLEAKMQSVKNRLREVATATGDVESKINQIDNNSFQQAPLSVQTLTRHVNEADQSLQEMAASGSRSWGRITNGALQAAQGSQRLSESIVEGSKQAEQSLDAVASNFTSLGSDVSNLRRDLSTLMNNLEATGQSIRDLATENPFDHIEQGARRVPRAINEVRQEVLQSESSLKDLADSADRSWGKITNGALEAAQGAERMSASIVQSAGRAEQGLKGMQNQMVRSRGATYSLGSSASSAASQLSIDLTQSAQDAAFGIENLAASAPFLAEQFGRVRRETGSFTGALSDIGSALMGPTGIIAGFTLLLTYKDSIISFFQSIGDSMSEAASEADELNNKIEKAFKESRDQFEQGIAQDFAEFARQLDPESEFGVGSSIEKMVEAPSASVEILRERLLRVNNILDEFNQKRKNIEDTVEQTTSSIESSIAAGPREQAITARTQTRITDRKARQRALDQMGITRERLKSLRRQRKRLSAVTENLGLESTKEARIRKELNRLYGVEGEKLDTLTDRFMKFRKAQKKANEEAETNLELQKRVREARVEAMEEGISKQINSINIAIQARRKEIKAIDAKTEKQKEQKNTLLDLLDQVEQRKKEAALEDLATLDAGLQEGEEVREAMNRINSRIDERIRKVRNLKGQYADLNEQQQEQAIEELEEERDEELGEVRDQAIFVNGRLVRREEFIQNTKENFNTAQQRIQSELDALRFEQESGVRVGPLMGDSMFGGAAGIGDQLGNLKKRFELRRELIEKQQEKLGRKFLRTGEDKYAQKWADLEKKRTRLTKKESQKRLQIVNQNMRSIGTAIESSPIGNATSNLIADLGSLWQAHYENQINWAEKNNKEKAAIISSVGSQVVSAASTIAEQTFQSWKSERAQDLKQQGKTAEERRKILKKEGKKRFQIMKGIKITEASVNTATGVTRALAELPPPASYAAAAATAAAGLFRIKQIAGMSIGDRIGGGGAGGGGAGAPGGEFTQRAAASSAAGASRVGTAMEAARTNDEDKINKTAERVGEEVGKQMPDKVTMDRDTAESAQEAANKQQTKLNK
jgi:DNA repair exonuclease SbcCD ATPase subunit